jgi:hypothetical protein
MPARDVPSISRRSLLAGAALLARAADEPRPTTKVAISVEKTPLPMVTAQC